MTAFNVVRFRVKPGNEQRFIDAHRSMRPGFKGFLGGSLIKTGDRTFCLVAEWRNYDAIVRARPEMIGMLDSVRGMLEDLGGGLGVTDPASGTVVTRLTLAKPKAKAKAKPQPKARPKAKPATSRKKPAKKRR